MERVRNVIVLGMAVIVLILFSGCLPSQCTRQVACTDEDGGFDPFTASAVSFKGVLTPDRCIDGSRLVEFTCGADRPIGETVECQYGCGTDERGFGRCLERPKAQAPISPPNFSLEPVHTCIDSDNGALSYAPGYVEFRGVMTVDRCLPNGNVTEYVCLNATVRGLEMSCLRGCRTNWQGFGACTPTAGGSPGQFALRAAGSGDGDGGDGDGGDGDGGDGDIPEFAPLAAIVAIVGGLVLFLRVRKD